MVVVSRETRTVRENDEVQRDEMWNVPSLTKRRTFACATPNVHAYVEDGTSKVKDFASTDWRSVAYGEDGSSKAKDFSNTDWGIGTYGEDTQARDSLNTG